MREKTGRRKGKLFLGISLSIWVALFIYIQWWMRGTFADLRTNVEDSFGSGLAALALIYVAICFIFPGFLLILSFIRSVYKILKHELEGGIKVCYMISALLVPLMFVLMILFQVQAFPSMEPLTLLFIEAAGFLASFILGSLPVGRRD